MGRLNDWSSHPADVAECRALDELGADVGDVALSFDSGVHVPDTSSDDCVGFVNDGECVVGARLEVEHRDEWVVLSVEVGIRPHPAAPAVPGRRR